MTAPPAWAAPWQDAHSRPGRSEAAPLVHRTRWASLARAGYGAALVCMPGRLISATTGRPASGRACAVARVLGVRHLAQGVICGFIPARPLVAAGSTADGLHAASMLLLAGLDPALRRAVLADAMVATTLAFVAAATLRS